MLNAMIWALACFGVVAADIALSVVLFSALGVASVFMGFSIDDLDIQLLQAAAQMASFLMALLWWRYLWPRSFMARWQGERPLGGGAHISHVLHTVDTLLQRSNDRVQHRLGICTRIDRKSVV